MARGFESKDIEYQQSEALRERAAGRGPTAAEHAENGRRGSIELALTRSRVDLENAKSPAHRKMLEQAIEALERQLLAHA
jgi:hypothetical protein